MPPRGLENVKIYIEHSLLSSSLGSLAQTELKQHGAVVDGAEYPMEYTITWEPHGDDSVLVVVDESTPFSKHSEQMRLHYPGRRIIYIVQGLENIDQELVHLQTSNPCFVMETQDASETVKWITRLLIDTTAIIKRTAPKIRSGHDAADTWRLTLQKIHGVSASIALTIVKKYPIMRSLWDAYNELSSDDAKKLLAQIQISDKSKLGIALSTRIYNEFMCNDPNFRINCILSKKKKKQIVGQAMNAS
jgi:hypothetical protein